MKSSKQMRLASSVLLFSMVAVSFSLGACSRSDHVMENQNPSYSPLSETTVHLNGKHVVVTLADARQIQAALQAYIDSSKESLEKSMPANLVEGLPKQVGEAWIDSAGSVRMGVWLLEAPGDELVLTYRVAPDEGQVGYQYVAHLSHNKQKWAVSSITYVKLLPRRQPGR